MLPNTSLLLSTASENLNYVGFVFHLAYDQYLISTSIKRKFKFNIKFFIIFKTSLKKFLTLKNYLKFVVFLINLKKCFKIFLKIRELFKIHKANLINFKPQFLKFKSEIILRFK
jgi:hypothetical protein